MDELRKKLENEIANEIENLEDLELGSEEHAVAVESVAKLYKLKLEDDRNEKEAEKNKAEFEEVKKQNEVMKLAEEAKLKDAKIDRYFRVGTAVGVVVLELAAYGHWYKKGLKFEETGTLTSPTMKGVISKFNPFKK